MKTHLVLISIVLAAFSFGCGSETRNGVANKESHGSPVASAGTERGNGSNETDVKVGHGNKSQDGHEYGNGSKGEDGHEYGNGSKAEDGHEVTNGSKAKDGQESHG